MQVTVTLTFGSEAEAAAYLGGSKPTAADAPTPGKPGRPAKADKPADTPPSASPAAAAPAPAPTEPAASPTPAAAAASDAVPYEKSGIPELVQKGAAKDRPGVIALLAKFGAKKGPELKAADYAAFKAEIEKLLAPADDLA